MEAVRKTQPQEREQDPIGSNLQASAGLHQHCLEASHKPQPHSSAEGVQGVCCILLVCCMCLKFSRKNISLTGKTNLENRICCQKFLIEFVEKNSKTKTNLFYFFFFFLPKLASTSYRDITMYWFKRNNIALNQTFHLKKEGISKQRKICLTWCHHGFWEIKKTNKY